MTQQTGYGPVISTKINSIFTFTSAESFRVLGAIDLAYISAIKVIGEKNIRVIFKSGLEVEFTFPTAREDAEHLIEAWRLQ